VVVRILLLLCLPLALIVRATIGAEGGSVGAWASFALFWLGFLFLVGVLSLDAAKSWRAGTKRAAGRSALAAAGLLLLLVSWFTQSTAADTAMNLLVLGCGLGWLFLRDRKRGSMPERA
jgi:hypothetical protein